MGAATYANGFVGYWLPEDVTGTIEVTYGDRTGTVAFTTTEEVPPASPRSGSREQPRG